MSGVGNWISGAVSSVGDWMGGNSTNPGALGTGEYGVQAPSQNLYNSPLGNQAGAWQNSQNQLQNMGNNAAPQAQNTQLGPAQTSAGPNLGQYNQTFAGQQALANQYGQMAAGNGPSLASVQAQQQGAQNLQGQLAAQGAASGMGGSPALASYNIANQAGQIQNQTNQNAVAGRTAEELGAMQAQGGLYNQMQGGALNAAGMGLQNNQFNAGQQNQFGLQQGQMNQQTSLANLQSQGSQNQLNASQIDLANQNLNGQIGNQYNAQLANAQNQVSLQGLQSGAYNNAATSRTGLITKVAGAAGSVMGL